MTVHGESTDKDSSPLSGWSYRAALWSMVLSAIVYLGFALWGGWREVGSAVVRVGLLGTVTVLSLSLLNYALRFYRWQKYLYALGGDIPPWASLRIYVAGFALTTTPAKAGEALRGVLLKPWGVPFARSLIALLSERLSDVLAIVVIALPGLVGFAEARIYIVVGIAIVVAALLVLSSRRLPGLIARNTRGSGRLSQLASHLSQLLEGARTCHAPRLLALATLLGLAAWISEAWAFHLVLQWMGADIGAALAMSIYATSMLVGALTFLPGGLGGAEATMIAMLHLTGMDTVSSIAATVLIRIATLWFAVVLGLTSLLRLPEGPAVNQRGVDSGKQPRVSESPIGGE